MKYTNFHEESFRQSVDTALRSVERILDVDRNPHLAEEVDHTYGNKYDLANHVTSAAIMALMNVLESMGLNADILKSLVVDDDAKKSKSSNSTMTLRFQATDTCSFLQEHTVEVPTPYSLETTEETTTTGSFTGSTTKSSITKVVKHVQEFHWTVRSSWEISLYAGTNVEARTILQDRSSSTVIITSNSKKSPIPETLTRPPRELSLTWLLQQINIPAMTVQFQINRQHDETKTPRRNKDIEQALEFMERLCCWSRDLYQDYFCGHLEWILSYKHNPAIPSGQPTPPGLETSCSANPIFCPLLPLFEDKTSSPTGESITPQETKEGSDDAMSILSSEFAVGAGLDSSPLFSGQDMHKLLNEQIRTMKEATKELHKIFPAKQEEAKLISVAEAILVLSCKQVETVTTRYEECLNYIEMMLKKQLIAAIGKEVHSDDLDQFVKFHNAKWLNPAPRPFCHAIRRPRHYPDGLLTIESETSSHPGGEKTGGKLEPIETLMRQVNSSSSQPLQVPLNAATTLELTGTKFLHGWVHHRFQSEDEPPKSYQLIARARQFSSFILMVGTMVGPNRLAPKEAIILQNKDEVLIPLLLNELPTPKEFKDAIQSLSPEQQRFAKSFRSMQLESSVFGVCVIQIKPQLEALLGLPQEALTKEMKLTQDLMELFVEYQVPSDLLSYDGPLDEEGSTSSTTTAIIPLKDKVANVKGHVQAVLDVISSAKSKQLQENAMRADMAVERAVQQGGGWTPDHHQAQRSLRMTKRSCASSASRVPPRAITGVSPAIPPRAICDMVMDEIALAPMMKMSSIGPPRGGQPGSCMPEVTNMEAPELSKRFSDGNDKVPISNASRSGDVAAVDFTCIPKMLDASMERHDTDNALRSTIIKAGKEWTRRRQENLLTKVESSTLGPHAIQTEKNKAFDLLDALSRSGSLPISCSELHVIVSVTHCFDNDVVGTVIQDNINPIEKLEKSTLLVACTIYGVSARDLISDATQLQRLAVSFPALFESPSS